MHIFGFFGHPARFTVRGGLLTYLCRLGWLCFHPLLAVPLVLPVGHLADLASIVQDLPNLVLADRIQIRQHTDLLLRLLCLLVGSHDLPVTHLHKVSSPVILICNVHSAST